MNEPVSASLSGALVIDKPVDLSSSQVVSRIKWALIRSGAAPKTLKIGHGGTLDPFASGVLLVLIGEGTKLSDCYLHSQKTYTGLIRLGIQTDSGDPTGAEKAHAPVPPLSPKDWQTHADRFVEGPYLQTPPMHSAKKQQGIALYDLARRGITVERKAIPKKIHSFRVEPASGLRLSFEVSCESGTYIRVLAEDLASKAGTLAHLEELRRTRSSDRAIGEALTLDQVERSLTKGHSLRGLSAFLPLSSLASHIPSLSIAEPQASGFRNGRTDLIERELRRADAANQPGRHLLLRREGSPVALLERPDPGIPYRLQRVFLF
jgi:tRNA pseudouridine55 synthase